MSVYGAAPPRCSRALQRVSGMARRDLLRLRLLRPLLRPSFPRTAFCEVDLHLCKLPSRGSGVGQARVVLIGTRVVDSPKP